MAVQEKRCPESKDCVYDRAGVVELKTEEDSKRFYEDAIDYWKAIPSTVDGVMGGLANISGTDVTGSRKLLKKVKELRPNCQTKYALDCGAGIGRVSKRLLLPLFDKVDLVEQNPQFLEKAKKYIGAAVDRVGNFFPTGLQDFTPETSKYDVIWCQWVLSHLTDSDLVSFLVRCASGLSDGGLIIVKENISNEESVLDEVDSSVTRSKSDFVKVFEEAHLKIIEEVVQDSFPKELYDVCMFVLEPR